MYTTNVPCYAKSFLDSLTIARNYGRAGTEENVFLLHLTYLPHTAVHCLLVTWGAVPESAEWEDNASLLSCSSLQCPRVFPSWWWPCLPCKPCSGWPRRKWWREPSVSVGIPVSYPSWLTPDYDFFLLSYFSFYSNLVLSNNNGYHLSSVYPTEDSLLGVISLSPHISTKQILIRPFYRQETEGHGN